MRAGRRFHAKAVTKPKPPYWDCADVTIFDGNAEIGSYERQIGIFGEETFEPFEIDGEWYALYSRDYTCTRIMSLPDCRDLGGEKPHGQGFCPVELYVPRFRSIFSISKNGEKSEGRVFEKNGETYDQDVTDVFGNPITAGPWRYLTVGSIAGCQWGDDATWKLEVFDLSRANEGVLTRSARFGYLELSKDVPLATAVRLYFAPDASLRATIRQQQEWDVASGALLDPFDL
jgi:hypothetical protein